MLRGRDPSQHDGKLTLLKFCVNLLKMLEERSENPDTQPRVIASASSPDAMHRELRKTSVDRPDTGCGTHDRPNSSAAPDIVPDLKNLQSVAAPLGYSGQESSRYRAVSPLVSCRTLSVWGRPHTQ